MATRRGWKRDELLVALNLYHKLTFGQLHARNQAIVALAEKLGRGAKWGLVPTPEYFSTIDDTVLLVALIEDVEGVENIDEIASVGLDLLWVGTGDLASDYRVPGETSHPLVMEAAARVLAACQKHQVACGFPARDAESARWAREQGYRAIGYGCAEQYVMQSARAFLASAGR